MLEISRQIKLIWKDISLRRDGNIPSQKVGIKPVADNTLKTCYSYQLKAQFLYSIIIYITL